MNFGLILAGLLVVNKSPKNKKKQSVAGIMILLDKQEPKKQKKTK